MLLPLFVFKSSSGENRYHGDTLLGVDSQRQIARFSTTTKLDWEYASVRLERKYAGGKTLNVSEQNFSVWSKEHTSGKVLQNTAKSLLKTAASGSPRRNGVKAGAERHRNCAAQLSWRARRKKKCARLWGHFRRCPILERRRKKLCTI